MKKIRTSFTFKIFTVYLSLNLIFPLSGIQTGMFNSYALTGGPSQPEFNSFTPIGTSDMVDLASGDFNYNIPIMDVGGYPLNLSYNSGITMDQEASWVGLGWNLNVGQINRNVRGLPDDFDGDEMVYENNIKKNITVGATFDINNQTFGTEFLSVNAGITVQHNNYQGISFKPSLGWAFDLSDNVSVGMKLQSSSYDGVNISPNISIHSIKDKTHRQGEKFNSSIGITYNSRQGLSSFNLSASTNLKTFGYKKFGGSTNVDRNTGTNGSSSISFVNNTFTPSKRTAYINSNFSFGLTFGPGLAFTNFEGGVSAFGSVQKIKNKQTQEKAYGYLNTHKASKNDILDFNRENDNIVSPNTLVLPVTNYTYDLYSIQGQGIGGMFRPFRSQVGYVYDKYVEDVGNGGGIGFEFEGGPGYLHFGANAEYSPSETSTGVWNTNATSYFKENKNSKLGLEKVYFKTIGELTVDKEYSETIKGNIGNENPIALKIEPLSNVTGKYASNKFREKTYNSNGYNYTTIPINNKITRTKRELRNTAVQKITALEAATVYATNPTIVKNENAEAHHIAAFNVLKNDGSTYTFGETAYNTQKIEATFAVKKGNDGDCQTGLVTYTDRDFSINNISGKDRFFSSVETPNYAHSYLLTAILSSDYQDVNNNGPDDKDLGSYTKFKYTNYYSNTNKYKWRVPYKNLGASYNQGLNSLQEDDKGSVIYGEKEIKYINTIETKTHIAKFELSPRKDALGVLGKHGGKGSSSKMYKINNIKLYSKPEYLANPTTAIPIKTAYFVYNYSLSPSVLNNSGDSSSNYEDPIDNTIHEPDYKETNEGPLIDANLRKGKLTLTKVYFTYANSKMGKYTPYKFNYEGYKTLNDLGETIYENNNYSYGLKDYDIWGNYKPNSEGGCNNNDAPTNAEFPFTQQIDKEQQDSYASAWSLTSIDLPSGGKIELGYETDDYQYVQDRKTMQMLKIAGVTRGNNIPSLNDLTDNNNIATLYAPGNYDNEAKYLIVQIDQNINNSEEFVQNYIGNDVAIDKPIYFRALMNMDSSYEYVEGYFEIDKHNLLQSIQNNELVFTDSGVKYGAIPMKFNKLEGGTDGNNSVNPISKAGWYFGRQYLNKIVGGGEETSSENIKTIAIAIVNSIDAVLQMHNGPNKELRNHMVARKMHTNKSWIRLNKSENKLGGGVRIKSLKMHDNWDEMTNNLGNDIYKQFYGQQYDYTLEDGVSSSGVATFEPNASKENPFVEPFYNSGERLVAPREVSYVEKPFGVSFFPSPQITYSRVTVKNLERINTTKNIKVTTNATGKVVNEFFTSKDFPTIADFTDIDKPGNYYNNPSNVGQSIADIILSSLFNTKITANSELTLSQGFTVTTNDMNAKTSKQIVYDENESEISSIQYIYSTNEEKTELKNELPVINKNGTIVNDKEIGTHFDVINDFRQSKSKSEVYGINGNLEIEAPIPSPPFIFIGGNIKANYALTRKTLRTAVTTKVIHKTGILKQKIAKDLGATVSTENLAWDAVTGQVLVTKTKNEYDDAYYSLNYPAHWKYKQMGLATNNLNFEGEIAFSGSNGTLLEFNAANQNINDYLIEGDELEVFGTNTEIIGIPPIQTDVPVNAKLWVARIDDVNNVTLIDNKGKIIGATGVTGSQIKFSSNLNFKVVRSGYRNLQSASMASITLMKNPIVNEITGNLEPNLIHYSYAHKIVNASAIEYTDLWSPQCECLGLPNFAYQFNDENNNGIIDINETEVTNDNPIDFATVGFNPYLYNVKGNFKAVKSYAYLTGRNTTGLENVSPRKDGFFTEFTPFYDVNNNWNVISNLEDKWTFASQVSKYSPYGVELENKDALGRYSSAQYGFNYTLPTAVSSNSKYTEMGFDSFEDYQSNPDCTTTHFAYREALNNELGNAEIINTESHTGHHAIKVKGGSRATLQKRIENCD